MKVQGCLLHLFLHFPFHLSFVSSFTEQAKLRSLQVSPWLPSNNAKHFLKKVHFTTNKRFQYDQRLNEGVICVQTLAVFSFFLGVFVPLYSTIHLKKWWGILGERGGWHAPGIHPRPHLWGLQPLCICAAPAPPPELHFCFTLHVFFRNEWVRFSEIWLTLMETQSVSPTAIMGLNIIFQNSVESLTNQF